MHKSTCFCSARWLISVLSFMSLSSVSPLSSPRAPPSSHSDRQEQDQEQQQSSGETQLVTSGSFLNFSKFPTDITVTLCYLFVHVCACSRVISSCSGDGMGGLSQWYFGERGAGDTKNGVCITGVFIINLHVWSLMCFFTYCETLLVFCSCFRTYSKRRLQVIFEISC